MMDKILKGNCKNVLKTLPAKLVNCCVTSPPYYGLRDYGEDEQVGLEDTPEKYVERIVDIFREVKRVLKDDGTLWLNLGDSYASVHTGGHKSAKSTVGANKVGIQEIRQSKGKPESYGLKNKDLIGVPWMVAFALRADGWYLRQDIIWHKPNPMPESVKDRCTKSHEYIFLLSKSPKYYYDGEAISELTIYHKGNVYGNRNSGTGLARGLGENADRQGNFSSVNDGTRNKRSVWEVSTKPYKEAHFATYPEKLIEPCILAGCPEKGIVLDPFFGAGTTGLVALKQKKNYIGIELNPEYIEIAEKRLKPFKEQTKLTTLSD